MGSLSGKKQAGGEKGRRDRICIKMVGFIAAVSAGSKRRQESSAVCMDSSRRQALVLLGTALIPTWARADDASENREKAMAALRKVTNLQDEAFKYTNQMNYVEAEKIWTKLIALNDTNAAAFSNRGNCRTSQGRFQEAIADFDRAVELAPKEPDPNLGKGVALEGLRKYTEAIENYEIANQKNLDLYGQEDPVTYNNRGTAYAGLGDWESAVKYYRKAVDLSREFVFARANEALARYQLGQHEQSMSSMRFLVRRYPGFADMHAALAAAYWKDGSSSASESEFASAVELDGRYKDIKWIREFRRWPPSLCQDMEDFLNLKR